MFESRRHRACFLAALTSCTSIAGVALADDAKPAEQPKSAPMMSMGGAPRRRRPPTWSLMATARRRST
ncbi:MAG: hypothetical protein QM770_14625 [Tepidisphaeraceae bacterium]